MRAMTQFRRTASAALLLGQRPDGHASAGYAGLEQADEADEAEAEADGQDGGNGTQTPLDRTLTKIGFGFYQKKLLVLCGLGWLADNMWLQCVAVILPRVQDEWAISDKWIGMLSSSTFTGMMIGAWSWGSYSDSFGRVRAFNGTLLVAALFGILSCFATTFPVLCMCFFGLGLGVGGSMPTDGTLFLENIPEEAHYLLTALSVFFSLGAMVTSVIALIVIPGRSCKEALSECDVQKENTGWRMVVSILAGLTLIFFCVRTFLFKLHESPKFLVTSGQKTQAVDVLRQIRDHNGSAFNIELADVNDAAPVDASRKASGEFDEDDDIEAGGTGGSSSRTASGILARRPSMQLRKLSQTAERATSGLRSAVQDYVDRLSDLLNSKLRKTTFVTWLLWFVVSAAYTIFNVFLPKYLEEKVGSQGSAPDRVQVLQEFCIYTLAGLPGALVGAFLEHRMGKKEAMAISTIATAIGIVSFIWVSSQTAVMTVTVWISFTVTLMYAIIYSYTPRLFPVSFRGSATGIASALSRLAGMTAPIVTGILLSISPSLPLYMAAALFLASAGFMFALP